MLFACCGSGKPPPRQFAGDDGDETASVGTSVSQLPAKASLASLPAFPVQPAVSRPIEAYGYSPLPANYMPPKINAAKNAPSAPHVVKTNSVGSSSVIDDDLRSVSALGSPRLGPGTAMNGSLTVPLTSADLGSMRGSMRGSQRSNASSGNRASLKDAFAADLMVPSTAISAVLDKKQTLLVTAPTASMQAKTITRMSTQPRTPRRIVPAPAPIQPPAANRQNSTYLPTIPGAKR